MSDHHAPLPPDLAALGERMRSDRPELGPLELDRIKMNVMRRSRSAPKGGFMRARLSILSFLVVGIVMLGTGGALAVSGFSGGSASNSEYGPPPGVKGVQATGKLGTKSQPCTENGSPSGSTGGTTNGTTGSGGTNGSANAQCSPTAPPTTTPAVSPSQQVSSGGKSLPFTGYAAIPVLIVGVALLGTGAVMRRRTRSEQDN